jgi:hypothetical protein
LSCLSINTHANTQPAAGSTSSGFAGAAASLLHHWAAVAGLALISHLLALAMSQLQNSVA